MEESGEEEDNSGNESTVIIFRELHEWAVWYVGLKDLFEEMYPGQLEYRRRVRRLEQILDEREGLSSRSP